MSDQEHIKSAIEAATTFLTENPTEAVATDSVATAKHVGGLKFEVSDPDGRSLLTDMVTGVGGEDSAPSPGWLLRAAAASCNATLIAMHAATAGVRLTELVVEVDSTSNDLGILGIDPEVPSGPLDMTTRVRVASPDMQPADLEEMARNAVDHCPVFDAVKSPVEMRVEVAVT